MKAYYEAPVKGDGLTSEMAYQPDLPSTLVDFTPGPPMADGWVVCTDPQGSSTVTVTVLVAGTPEYHQQLRAEPNILWLADVEET